MHKFLRAVGFSQFTRKRDIERLLRELAKNAVSRKHIQLDMESNVCEIRAELAPDMGVAIVGEMDDDGEFREEFYYPYLISRDVTSYAECSIQRHAEKETFAGLLDEYHVGISLIFYMTNSMEYRERLMKRGRKFYPLSASLTGLSVSGKVLLPIKKTAKQIEMAKVTAKNRDSLLEAAKNGDPDAMETLTIEDMDLYSQISRRVMKEDIYSIIETCFMPSGIECDQYSMIGDIKKVDVLENSCTGEKVYNLTVECNDLIFHVGINQADLLGEPAPGRRFKGKVWMQGNVSFSA